MKVIVKDKNSMYYNKEAEVVRTYFIEGKTIFFVSIDTSTGGSISFALNKDNAEVL